MKNAVTHKRAASAKPLAKKAKSPPQCYICGIPKAGHPRARCPFKIDPRLPSSGAAQDSPDIVTSGKLSYSYGQLIWDGYPCASPEHLAILLKARMPKAWLAAQLVLRGYRVLKSETRADFQARLTEGDGEEGDPPLKVPIEYLESRMAEEWKRREQEHEASSAEKQVTTVAGRHVLASGDSYLPTPESTPKKERKIPVNPAKSFTPPAQGFEDPFQVSAPMSPTSPLPIESAPSPYGQAADRLISLWPWHVDGRWALSRDVHANDKQSSALSIQRVSDKVLQPPVLTGYIWLADHNLCASFEVVAVLQDFTASNRIRVKIEWDPNDGPLTVLTTPSGGWLEFHGEYADGQLSAFKVAGELASSHSPAITFEGEKTKVAGAGRI